MKRNDLLAAAGIACGLLLYILAAVLLLSCIARAVAASAAEEPGDEPAPHAVEPVVHDPAWDIPATEHAACEDTPLGEFVLTAYCPCPRCCGKWANGYTATGTLATEGRTIAVDPRVIPYGSRVLLIFPDGTQREYIAEDCGGGIQNRHIDLFFQDHETARVFGMQSAMVYITEGGAEQ